MKARDKLVPRAEVTSIRGRVQGTLVFTNGCFDLLHAGHVQYLESARCLGNALIVGLNSDDSTRRLKGPGRPYSSQEDRSLVLGGLSAVTFVTIFDEDTAGELVREIKPEFYVKGGDYSPDPHSASYPVEGNVVSDYGGEVRILPLTPGLSTSTLIQRIQASRSS